jgi:hypothetical protein
MEIRVHLATLRARGDSLANFFTAQTDYARESECLHLLEYQPSRLFIGFLMMYHSKRN